MEGFYGIALCFKKLFSGVSLDFSCFTELFKSVPLNFSCLTELFDGSSLDFSCFIELFPWEFSRFLLFYRTFRREVSRVLLFNGTLRRGVPLAGRKLPPQFLLICWRFSKNLFFVAASGACFFILMNWSASGWKPFAIEREEHDEEDEWVSGKKNQQNW